MQLRGFLFTCFLSFLFRGAEEISGKVIHDKSDRGSDIRRRSLTVSNEINSSKNLWPEGPKIFWRPKNLCWRPNLKT